MSTSISAELDTALASPEWLARHLHDPGLRIVEVDVTPARFDAGHIAGAVLWNVYRDLRRPDYSLVDGAAVGGLIERSGIGPETTVVVYGYAPALAYWMLTLLGHADVRILDASRDAWQADGLPWSTEVEPPAPTRHPVAGETPGMRADHRLVRAASTDPSWRIADVRTAPEYAGERFWPSGGSQPGGRSGHVPGAVHVPIDGVLDDRGAFRPADELRRLFAALDGAENVITYCTVAGRATTAWFVLTRLLGRTGVRVYDGSWAEWGLLPDAPVEVG